MPRRVARYPTWALGLARFALASVALTLLLGCEPKLVVGTWSCSGSADDAGGETGVGAMTDALATPWSTGFESGFCDYAAPSGFCYAEPGATYELVDSPAHAGNHAAAFSVSAEAGLDGNQTRCVRQGELASAAYYSAYFFIPTAPSDAVNWNLMHFRSGDAAPFHGLWDVTLAEGAGGDFHVVVFDFLRMQTRTTDTVPAVPIGSWFQLEVYLRRAADATGAFAVYQDGELALELNDLSTDDGEYGQWYVGNYAIALTPPESTLYVDDVAIRPAP